ncbi:MAG: hypothetical protein PHI12_06805 [Dehalococcoidales bacterium]|nr:hypothetical protein [Dehalococcoidales bacterium]
MPDEVVRKYRLSKSSRPVTIRLPNDVLCTIERRIEGRRSRWASVGEYLKERIVYDTQREHKRRAVK